MVRTGNLKEVAYESMLEKIRGHALEPGKVYSERQISAEIGVSRTPLHSALLQLEKDGYVDVLPSRGFMLHQFSAEDVRRTFEVRSAVEFYCCSRIMDDLQKDELAAKQQVERLKDVLSQQEAIIGSSRDIVAYERCDFSFHEEIVSYAGNPEFDRLFSSYMFWIQDLAEQSLRHEGRMEDALKEHQAIVDALEAGDVARLYGACMEHFTVPQALNLEDLSRAGGEGAGDGVDE